MNGKGNGRTTATELEHPDQFAHDIEQLKTLYGYLLAKQQETETDTGDIAKLLTRHSAILDDLIKRVDGLVHETAVRKEDVAELATTLAGINRHHTRVAKSYRDNDR